MRSPEEALAEARRRAAAAGPSPDPGVTSVVPLGSARRLAEWAIIEPDEAEVYSTRRFGGPITAFKRVLVRLLRQYFVQVNAQQSRFNAEVAAHVMRLEERVQQLERQTGARDGSTDQEAKPR